MYQNNDLLVLSQIIYWPPWHMVLSYCQTKSLAETIKCLIHFIAMTFTQLPLLPHSEKASKHTSMTRHAVHSLYQYSITLLSCVVLDLCYIQTWIMNFIFLCCAIESALEQKLSAIKVELEFTHPFTPLPKSLCSSYNKRHFIRRPADRC